MRCVDREGDVGALCPPAFERGPDEVPEQRVGTVGTALELGVELARDEPRVIGQLDDLHQLAVRGLARAHQTCIFEAGTEARVDLVTVAVAFVDQLAAVGRGSFRSRRQPAGVGTEAHRAPETVEVLARQDVDDRMR